MSRPVFPRHWSTCTVVAWCTVISSPQTSSSPQKECFVWEILAWQKLCDRPPTKVPMLRHTSSEGSQTAGNVWALSWVKSSTLFFLGSCLWSRLEKKEVEMGLRVHSRVDFVRNQQTNVQVSPTPKGRPYPCSASRPSSLRRHSKQTEISCPMHPKTSEVEFEHRRGVSTRVESTSWTTRQLAHLSSKKPQCSRSPGLQRRG